MQSLHASVQRSGFIALYVHLDQSHLRKTVIIKVRIQRDAWHCDWVGGLGVRHKASLIGPGTHTMVSTIFRIEIKIHSTVVI